MDKKIIKGLGIGAMCLAGAVGLTGCNTNVDDADEKVKIVSIDVLEETIPESLEAGDFDEGNIVLLVKYSDNSEKKIHLTEEYVQSAYKNKLLQTGEHTIWIDYNGFTDILNINVTMTETSIAEKFQNAVKYAVEHDSVMTYKESYYDGAEQQEYTLKMYHHYNTESEEVEMFDETEYDVDGTKIKQYSFSNATDEIAWIDGYCRHGLNSYFSNKSDANYSYSFVDDDLVSIAKSGVGLFTAQYSGEIKKGQLVYTATFTKTEDGRTIECVFTFAQDKLLTAKSSLTYTRDMGEAQTDVIELEYKYQALTDAQMHRTDAMSKKSILLSKITELNTLTTQLKSKAFSLSMRDEDEGDETVTYTHEANSDVLTSSSGNLNFTDLFSTITTYGEVTYASADGVLYVDYIMNGEITFTIKNGQITNVSTYRYKTLGTKEITISYAE